MKWLFCVLCLFFSNAFAFEPKLDDRFIQEVLGKSVSFDPKKSGGKALPNCLATVLRAGGFLPVFAASDTEQFPKTLLPQCFVSVESPRRGDLGLLVYRRKSGATLAHAVLFLDSDRVFEKKSPNFEDKFRMNSWKKIKALNRRPALNFELYRYRENPECPLADLNLYYSGLEPNNSFSKLENFLEARIRAQKWSALSSEEQKAIKDLKSQRPSLRELTYREQIEDEVASMLQGLRPLKRKKTPLVGHDDVIK